MKCPLKTGPRKIEIAFAELNLKDVQGHHHKCENSLQDFSLKSFREQGYRFRQHKISSAAGKAAGHVDRK